MVVIVSEETGAVSVAENGRLIRNLTIEGLESLLVEMLSRPTVTLSGRKSSSPKEELLVTES